MTIEELRAALAYVSACLTDIHTRAEGNVLGEDEQRSFDEGVAAVADYRAKIAAYELREAAARQALVDGRVEPGNAPNVIVRDEDNLHDLSTLRSREVGTREHATEIRDRAMQVIESWKDHGLDEKAQESAERFAAAAGNTRDRNAQRIAAHIVRYSHPDFVEGFYDYLSGGWQAVRSDAQELVRTALNEGTTTQGGFLVPPMLDPSIILTNDGRDNPFRQISTVKTIDTQTWKGVTSAGVTAEWTAEAAQVADATPTFGQPSITPVRADAYIQSSREVLQDTAIASEVSGLFADARDALESTGFAVGTGSTQPVGIVTRLQLTTASRVSATTNGAFGAADIFALDNALAPRHRNNASWLADKSIYNLVRGFGVGSSVQGSTFWVDLGGGNPPVLIGYPAHQASAMAHAPLSAATASNDDILVLGDFRKFAIVDRIGPEILFEPLVKGANQRPTGEVGWVMFWRVGSDALDANAFRLLRV